MYSLFPEFKSHFGSKRLFRSIAEVTPEGADQFLLHAETTSLRLFYEDWRHSLKPEFSLPVAIVTGSTTTRADPSFESTADRVAVLGGLDNPATVGPQP